MVETGEGTGGNSGVVQLPADRPSTHNLARQHLTHSQKHTETNTDKTMAIPK